MEFITLKTICHLKRSTKFFLGFFVLAILLACSKDEDLPFSSIPSIELLGLSHDTIRQYQDVMTISLEYTDGDGDLGFIEPDRYALFIRDKRLDDFDGFFIGPLAPPDTLVPIRGILNVEFPNLFIFGNSTQESTDFEIKMIDRAGNESNLLTTKTILITKP
jgi:hypothetical protein